MAGKKKSLDNDFDEPDIEEPDYSEDVDGLDPAEEQVISEDGPAPDDYDTELKAKALTEGDLDATRLYLNEIGFSSLLTAEEEKYYSRRALKGDEASRKRMIEGNYWTS
jgi:RNA polymerase nonessential primary-like sigma factor